MKVKTPSAMLIELQSARIRELEQGLDFLVFHFHKMHHGSTHWKACPSYACNEARELLEKGEDD